MFDWHRTIRTTAASRHRFTVVTRHVWIGGPQHPSPYPRALTAAQVRAAEECAERAGEQAGAAVGSWAIDGNTSAFVAETILRELDDCSYEYPSPLSGEWADEPTPDAVIADAVIAAGIPYSVTVEDWAQDSILAAYEEGFRRAYERQVISDARAIVPDWQPGD